jgi:hypothetical protein
MTTEGIGGLYTSPIVVTIVKPRSLRWTRYSLWLGWRQGMYRNLCGDIFWITKVEVVGTGSGSCSNGIILY